MERLRHERAVKGPSCCCAYSQRPGVEPTRPWRAGSIPIHQDADVYVARLGAAGVLEHDFASARFGWVQLIEGELTVNGQKLSPGDGAAISDEERLSLTAVRNSHFLFFDLN